MLCLSAVVSKISQLMCGITCLHLIMSRWPDELIYVSDYPGQLWVNEEALVGTQENVMVDIVHDSPGVSASILNTASIPFLASKWYWFQMSSVFGYHAVRQLHRWTTVQRSKETRITMDPPYKSNHVDPNWWKYSYWVPSEKKDWISFTS